MKDKAENVGVGYDMKTQLESLHLICKAMGEMKNFCTHIICVMYLPSSYPHMILKGSGL